jgi:hypothetical protein
MCSRKEYIMRHLIVTVLSLFAVLSIAACIQDPVEDTSADINALVIEPGGSCSADQAAKVAEPVDVFRADSVQRFVPGSTQPQITPLPSPGPTTQVSCSSRDRVKDCFCGDKGCWRTQTDCGCCT